MVPRRRLLAVLLVLAAVVALGSAVARRGSPPGPAPAASSSALPAPPLPAGPAELRLLAPLAPGSDLGGFTVREIHGVQRGSLRVSCARGKAVVHLDVALADPDAAALPPATAGRYAIFYSLRGASPDDGDALARALGRVIEANASAPAPPGMTTFTPDPKPATPI